MIPVIPLLCIAGLVSSALGLKWYVNLSEQDRFAADQFAAELSLRIYNRAIDNLSEQQLEHIHRLVRELFM